MTSSHRLPDGWVDPAVSEAIAKKKDAEREERMKKMRAMQKLQAEARAAEEKQRAAYVTTLSLTTLSPSPSTRIRR